MGVKFDLYEENRVREYWMVEPSEKVIYVYVLKDEKFIGLKPFIEDDKIYSSIFSERKFEVEDVFKD